MPVTKRIRTRISAGAKKPVQPYGAAKTELADLITLCARTHAASQNGASQEPWPLTGALIMLVSPQ